MGGQCPGAPELKGAPEREEKKLIKNRREKIKRKKKEKKEKEEKKRENQTFQTPGQGPYPIYPHESQ